MGVSFCVSEADYTLDDSFWIDESPAGESSPYFISIG